MNTLGEDEELHTNGELAIICREARCGNRDARTFLRRVVRDGELAWREENRLRHNPLPYYARVIVLESRKWIYHRGFAEREMHEIKANRNAHNPTWWRKSAAEEARRLWSRYRGARDAYEQGIWEKKIIARSIGAKAGTVKENRRQLRALGVIA